MHLPGWHTSRKIIVIESDDWGSIRMPSREAFERLLRSGINVDKCPFCRYDSLARSSDLSPLFEVLTAHKDKYGNHPVITANTIVANPVFEKIAASQYTSYHYEPFTETLKRPPYDANAFQLWREGMEQHLFHPQFHGREHVGIRKWLAALQQNSPGTTIGFENQTYGLTHETSGDICGNYMSAFDSCMEEDLPDYRQCIQEGTALFETLFGYRSRSFIAPAYTWSHKVEPILKEEGVLYLQGLLTQRVPLDQGNRFTHTYRNFTGYRNKAGQYYLMRNVFFEPAIDKDTAIVDKCMHRIQLAFRCRKPAIISSHRLNYIGAIDPGNRENTLSLLHTLLQKITHQWPDVEFMTSDALGDVIRNSHEKK